MNLQFRAAESFWEDSLIVSSHAKHGAKKVQRDDITDFRPNPLAVVQRRCKWIIGDVTEVLDCNTWKLGKIAKMLENNYFVIRLADCIQLKEFHISSLRVPILHAPLEPFPASKKGAERVRRPTADRSFPRPKASLRAGYESYEVQGHSTKKSEAISATNLKISGRCAPRGQAPADALLRRSCKKRKAAAVEPHQPRQRRTPRPDQRAPGARALNAATAAPDGCSYRPSPFRGETECSVASCSANDARHSTVAGEDDGRRLRAAGGAAGRSCFFLPDDATSSACPPCTSGRENGDGEPAVDVHELELEAYQSTVRALYASGPLTWEQESLLTNLRLSLNISNEEHLLQLRHLLSS